MGPRFAFIRSIICVLCIKCMKGKKNFSSQVTQPGAQLFGLLNPVHSSLSFLSPWNSRAKPQEHRYTIHSPDPEKFFSRRDNYKTLKGLVCGLICLLGALVSLIYFHMRANTTQRDKVRKLKPPLCLFYLHPRLLSIRRTKHLLRKWCFLPLASLGLSLEC